MSPSPTKKTQERTDPAPPLLRLIEQGLLKSGQKVLCYGCGRGADVAWLKRRGFTASGYDPHPPFGYAELPAGKFDCVLLIYLLARLKTDDIRRTTFEKAYDYVRPGGWLGIITRNWPRLAGQTENATPEGAAEYLEHFLNGVSHDGRVVAGIEPGDPSMGVLWRKPGVYTPKRPVHWVQEGGDLDAAIRRLSAAPRVGLDVETTLDEPRKLCTIQLSMDDTTWILDALAFEDLAPVKTLLEDADVEKVIHNASFEEQMFAKHGIRIRNVYDTLPVSRKKYRGQNVEGGHKLGEVCERELGIYLDKSLQTSDWTQRPLSQAQLDYAAVDAEVLLDLHRVFNPPPPPENLELF